MVPMCSAANSNDIKRRFKYWQNRTLISTIVCYAVFYLVRKNLSMAMPGMEEDLGITKVQLGVFLSLHGVVYGVSKFLSGFAADRFSSRHLLVCGLLMCSICNIIFGSSSSLMIFGVVWVVNGLFQGMGFPPIARLLTHWIPPKELATKMSRWNTSHSIGAGLAYIICGCVVSLGWRWCFYVPSGIAFLCVAFIWFSVCDTPKSVGLPEMDNNASINTNFNSGDSKKDEQIISASDELSSVEYRRLLMKKVFKNKAIWVLGVSNIFVYILRFAILDWGPMLLKEWKGLSLTNAGWIVAAFEISGVFGILLSGWVTDKFFNGRSQRVCVISLLLASFFVFLFWRISSAPPWLNITFLILSGFFIYGPQALGGVATANIATRKVAATAVGFHGFWGYLSTLITGLGVGIITAKFGWSYTLGFVFCAGLVGAFVFALIWNSKADGYDDV
ncbi:MAG: MFS transporter [Endomicrobium sp.]|jgi:OPA family glycerol-3-phosphate transporter-like MFS transporter/OPA family sugar phosphate sensor protein UhpC-like MFS transporter|nr:MFS transporter [Endomicrobium sp.]